MNPKRAQRIYKNHLHEPVTIRRIVGSGSARTVSDFATMGRVFKGERKELVAGISQQDVTAIVNAELLESDGLTGDVVIGDYLIEQSGAEYTVTEVKPRRVKAVMIAYELTLRGP